ncbi:hypothetical protein PHLGIDRAFT_101768 [Phlebiopsis gigantea 11061_1 CR5-6]|uniref:protein-ribulosamine 3-kinase n=1 Tax=Phlebiopsis gigantea (strain 11061_1 CR5-6) TaxID=745531 RepID=A0A0C3PS40_PHLG1|nr:hypothetical protein PHLGIDRAFT_101768 [Phlebiopsis gigantea 11061_1 CR5-6]
MAAVHPIISRAIHAVEPDVFLQKRPSHIQSTSGKAYFAKVGSLDEVEQFIAEAEALKAMHLAAPGLAPRLVDLGVIAKDAAENDSDIGRPYFVSEYKNMSALTDASAKRLAQRLATEMHACKSTHGFGFAVPTFCGRTKQDNGWYDSWEACYDALLGGLLSKLEANGGFEELCRKGNQVRKSVIPALLGPLAIQPVLLHGDLWSGNTGTDEGTGEPVIFDPSAYYGHNEADLAIARIFGGFPRSFFTTYHQYLPKSEPEDQYELRGDLYELYHYLNHTFLFGKGYAGSSKAKMDKLLTAFPD